MVRGLDFLLALIKGNLGGGEKTTHQPTGTLSRGVYFLFCAQCFVGPKK